MHVFVEEGRNSELYMNKCIMFSFLFKDSSLKMIRDWRDQAEVVTVRSDSHGPID